VPRSDWLAELVKAYQSAEKPQTVVAGYYTAQIKTAFQQAVTPYALVMPDRVDPVNFLPATRSMLLPKTVWKKLGGFDRRFSDNEDYDFARRLRRQKNPIVFARQAQVSWQPRSNLLEFWAMIYRFARGDAQARLFRPKVAFIFIRYSLGVGILLWSWPWAAAGLVAYAGWSISKNLRHVPNGWYWLPLLQVTSDLAVMLGTVEGLMIQRD
jgi:GT2 family glycosyltransferase